MKYLVVICLFLVSCSPDTPKVSYSILYEADGFKIVEIDSCEYVLSSVHNGYSITHKGNCKHCKK